ncbi:hypothetical protein FHR32_005324 [Streptosporangium album]|uniref:Uncharacterized protein n=1 Tax=Streptosporangium album TaxID=47479 RepID=A0A7W7WAZ0_9ACTN|nr:hypothetical protein [Streptosporangium album]
MGVERMAPDERRQQIPTGALPHIVGDSGEGGHGGC